MTDFRIPEVQWKAHDLKKLVGLLILLLAACLSWFFRPVHPSSEFSISSPSPWPKSIEPGADIVIEGVSNAKTVRLIVGDSEFSRSEVPAPPNKFRFKVPAATIVNQHLEIIEVFGESNRKANQLPRVTSIKKSVAQSGRAFTLDSHKNGGDTKAGVTVFGGKAKPGAKVYLFIDQYVCGLGTADSNGRWSVKRFVHESRKLRTVFAKLQATGEKTPAIKVDVNP